MNTKTSQRTSEEDSPCEAVAPANSVLIQTIPSSSITQGTLIDNSNGSVQPTTTPLTPTASAQYTSSTNERISITTTVKIDSAVTINDLQIYMANNVSNDGSYILAELYVGYCYQEEVPAGLYPYTFTFEIDSASTEGAISEIELYLYDEDPITSSGKKATVQPST